MTIEELFSSYKIKFSYFCLSVSHSFFVRCYYLFALEYAMLENGRVSPSFCNGRVSLHHLVVSTILASSP